MLVKYLLLVGLAFGLDAMSKLSKSPGNHTHHLLTDFSTPWGLKNTHGCNHTFDHYLKVSPWLQVNPSRELNLAQQWKTPRFPPLDPTPLGENMRVVMNSLSLLLYMYHTKFSLVPDMFSSTVDINWSFNKITPMENVYKKG